MTYPAFGRPSINTCFLALCETRGNPRAPWDPRPRCENNLHRHGGTWPVSFTSLQAQDRPLQPAISCLHPSDIFSPLIFIPTRHPFISQHEVRATLGRGRIYSFPLKTFPFTGMASERGEPRGKMSIYLTRLQREVTCKKLD